MMPSVFEHTGALYRRAGCAILSLALLSGCATLPSSGPTGSQIIKSSQDAKSNLGALPKIVELTDLSALPVRQKVQLEPPAEVVQPTDLIASGDVLDISVYESGVGLFSLGGRANTESAALDASVQAQKLPTMRVDDGGNITLPYAGRIRASGRTASELEGVIRRALLGMSQNPQVIVTIREAIGNSIILGGEIGRPGRLVLPTNRETVSDAIALGGGYRGEAKDMTVILRRRDTDFTFRLSEVLSGSDRNLKVYPGDKITIVKLPQTFAVMGAPGRIEQIPFSGPSLSLAEAVALAGGANPNLGDPAAIFVFRFVPTAEGQEEPVIYHLNMMKAGSYFISQRFVMTDKDVVYFGNARANQPSKLVQIISQLFAPIVTIRDIARSAN